MTAPLHLVACVAGKLDRSAPAAELYRSDWFVKARAYVEAIGAPWRILSAEHGLLDPAELVAPYERTLHAMRPWERLAWGERVCGQLFDLAPRGAEIVFLAGKVYREAVTGVPPFTGWHASAPMAGLGIGQQKAWLAGHARPRGQLQLAL